MPYVKQNRREQIHKSTENGNDIIDLDQVVTPGDLNFAITELALKILEDRRGSTGDCKIQYGHINEIIGAIECAKLEFYRRAAASYEDKKIKENGDVYWKEEG